MISHRFLIKTIINIPAGFHSYSIQQLSQNYVITQVNAPEVISRVYQRILFVHFNNVSNELTRKYFTRFYA